MVAYTNDLRLSELATGEGSGTWGNTTNTNLELIAEAFSFGTEAITTNADTHTTTIADGSTDPGRSLFLKYTGTLDSTCTITIGPNTVSKLWFIENATSGSQSIIIKQGSGATVTIANGQTKAIYSDGAGSGGAMVDAFTDLSVPSFFVSGDLDVDGTTNLDVVDIDGAVDFASTTAHAGNATFADNAKAIFGAGSDLQIYHDGSASYIDDAGTGNLRIRANSSLSIQKYTGETMGVFTADGSVLLAHDNATKLETTSTGIDVTGTVTADGLTVDGAISQSVTAGTVPIDIDTNISSSEGSVDILKAKTVNDYYSAIALIREGSTNTGLAFKTTGSGTLSEAMRIDSSGNVGIGTSSPSATLALDKNTTTQHRVLDLENNSITYSMYVDQDNSSTNSWSLFDTTNSQTALRYLPSSSGYWQFYTNGTERMRIDASGNLALNSNGSVASLDGVAGMQIGNSSAGSAGVALETSNRGYLMYINGTSLAFWDSSNNSNRMVIDASGNLLVGKTTAAFGTAGVELKPSGETYVTRASATPLYVRRNTDDGDIVQFWKDGSPVGSIGTGSGLLTIGTGTGNLVFENALVAPCSDSSVGSSNGVVDLGTSSRRFKDLHLSGHANFTTAYAATGIYLGAYASPNLLDDYEEGTWTLGLNTSNSDATISSVNTTGYYTKIGNLVTVNIYNAGANITVAGSGSAYITGLPFTVANGNGYYSTVTFSHTNMCTTQIDAYAAVNTTFCVVLQVGTITNAVFAIGNPKYMMMSLTYMTSQ